MWNKKDNKYLGKSEISVKWHENDVYTCKVIHQGHHYLQNITKCSDIIVEPRFPDIQTFSGNSDMATDTMSLLCIISNYWPQNIDLVWLKNGNKLDKKESVFTSMKQENGMYSGNSLLNVSIESWNKETYSCQVTHQNKDYTQAVQKPQDFHTLYEDDGGEELRELEEINNMWTTTSTFIALFLVTLIYSSFVTFVKVK